jgi:hypothetical protein
MSELNWPVEIQRCLACGGTGVAGVWDMRCTDEANRFPDGSTHGPIQTISVEPVKGQDA